MYATKREIAAAIPTNHKPVRASEINVIAFYSYRQKADLDHGGQRIEWILVRHKVSDQWIVMRKIALKPVEILFSRSDAEKAEAVFHWQANIDKL